MPRWWIPRDERRYLLSIWRGAAPGDPFEFQHRILRTDGNRDAQALLNDGGALIGCDADDALPPELVGVLHLAGGVHRPIHLAGLPFRAVCREMSDTAARGKLLVITHEYQRELT